LNYFELHLGDYEAATAHLSMLEDAAYCRMLRIYYRTERPLPADIKQVCRLVRAASKPERDAVQQVLDDFFTLQADGWHQARCDEELQRFQEGEPEREAKKANEETRLKRHREERAALFKLLTEAGQHAPWNIKMEELRRLAAPYQPARATAAAMQAPPLPATAPATPATATQAPIPRHQTPDTNPQGLNTAVPVGTGADAPPQVPAAAPADPGPAPSPLDTIFAVGLPMLLQANVPDRNARTFLGHLRKLAKGRGGDPAVVQALNRCAAAQALDPITFLQGCFKAPAVGDDVAGLTERAGRLLGFDTPETIGYADYCVEGPAE
jgi:uncharacterized protein YdaU (DUF1376 family)